MPETEAATDHRNTRHRNCVGTVCARCGISGGGRSKNGTLMEKKYGTEKAIPQMIMAGVSCDDIFVIVLFTTFLSIAQGGHANVLDFVNIPVSIVLGIILGAVTGLWTASFL